MGRLLLGQYVGNSGLQRSICYGQAEHEFHVRNLPIKYLCVDLVVPRPVANPVI